MPPNGTRRFYCRFLVLPAMQRLSHESVNGDTQAGQLAGFKFPEPYMTTGLGIVRRVQKRLLCSYTMYI